MNRFKNNKSYINGILVLFILMFFNSICAQTGKMPLYDITLKNGVVLRASVLEMGGGKIKISQMGLVSEYPDSLVVSLKLSEAVGSSTIQKEAKNLQVRKVYGLLQAGFLGGIVNDGWGTYPQVNMTMDGSVHYFFKPNWSAGIGFGGQYYTSYDAGSLDLKPEIRWVAKQAPRSLYMYAQPGISFSISNNSSKNGVSYFAGYGLGKMFRTRNGETFSFSLGLRHQELFTENNNWTGTFWEVQSIKYNINRVEIKFGFGF